MRAYARKFGETRSSGASSDCCTTSTTRNTPRWTSTRMKGAEILRARSYPEEMIQAILSHASHTGIPRETRMAKTLYAVDELTGFVTAVALVRPNKKVADVEPKSVKKKMKDKAFARAVNRDEIREGAELLGVEFDEHVRTVIDAMAGIAPQLGLEGIELPA